MLPPPTHTQVLFLNLQVVFIDICYFLYFGTFLLHLFVLSVSLSGHLIVLKYFPREDFLSRISLFIPHRIRKITSKIEIKLTEH